MTVSVPGGEDLAEPKPLPFEMIVDHPFFRAIAERNTGALLFAGVITDPTRQ